MAHIIGTLSFQTKENVIFKDFDWKSLEHHVAIMLTNHEWKQKVNIFNNKNCQFKYIVNQDQVSINGICDDHFDYGYWIKMIVRIFDNRYVVINGRIIINYENSDKIYVVIIKNNEIKIREGTF